jgi:hypothetical protein
VHQGHLPAMNRLTRESEGERAGHHETTAVRPLTGPSRRHARTREKDDSNRPDSSTRVRHTSVNNANQCQPPDVNGTPRDSDHPHDNGPRTGIDTAQGPSPQRVAGVGFEPT